MRADGQEQQALLSPRPSASLDLEDPEAAPPDAPPSPPTPPFPAGVGRLLSEARPEACTLALGTAFLALSAVCSLAVPGIAGRMIDTVSQVAGGGGDDPSADAARAAIDAQLLQIVAVLLAGGVAGGVRSYLFDSSGERVIWRLRLKLFSQVMVQEVGFFDATRTGELLNRLSEDTRLMKDAVTNSVSDALRSAATLVAGVALMAATSWKLTLLVLTVIPITLVTFMVFADISRRYMTRQLAASASAAAVADECLSSLRTVRSFAQEPVAMFRYNSAAADILRYGLKQAAAGALFSGVSFPLASCLLMSVLWYGARLVVDGDLSVGALNAFMLYAIYCGSSAGMLAGTMTRVVQALGAGQRVFELSDRTPLQPPSGSAQPAGSPEGCELSLRDVWFAYPQRRGQWVLRGASLQVRAGERVALVGHSGAGKSSVMALVQRFYDPQRGHVMLDGVPVAEIDHSYLHHQMALVAQEPVLFADTIAFNVAFGVQSPADLQLTWAEDQGGDSSADGVAAPGGGSGAKRRGWLGRLGLRRGGGGAGGRQGGGGWGRPPPRGGPPGAGGWGAAAALLPTSTLSPALMERVVEACKLAHAHDFICSFPDGYNTRVGERGVRLSGGQRQRIAIARALMMRPRLLLLDEATSALDADSEAHVQRALERAAQGRSVLVIAHRLSTVRDADRVAVLAQGVVVEEGRHDELLGMPGGAYAQLVRRQLTDSVPLAAGGPVGGADEAPHAAHGVG